MLVLAFGVVCKLWRLSSLAGLVARGVDMFVSLEDWLSTEMEDGKWLGSGKSVREG